MGVKDWLKRRATHRAGTIVAASAALGDRGYSARRRVKFTDWQAQAWNAYHTIPEIKYGVTWKSSAGSRARLFVGVPDVDGQGEPVPADDPIVTAVMEQFFEGFAGQSEFLRRVFVLLDVPGEAYVVGVRDEDGRTRWTVTNGNNLAGDGSNDLSIRLDYDSPRIPLGEDNSTIFKIWRSDGQYELRPDSPVRSLLPLVSQIVKLDMHIDATAESRLAGAGILAVPDGATTVNPGGGEGFPLVDDPFIADLMEGMTVPISDRDSASAVVPIVVKVPAGENGELRYITFSTPFDERVLELRTADIKRIAVGLDIPSEILTGISESNHWTAWQISEDAIKLNIEPILGLVCDALTKQYLWPALRSLNVEDVEKYVVYFDTTELVLRPNRGPEARELYALGVLSAEATRRESGFNEDDAPRPAEQLTRLLMSLLQTNPELSPQILPQLQDIIRSGGDGGEAPALPLAVPSVIDQAGRDARDEIPAMVATKTITSGTEEPQFTANAWDSLERNGQLKIAEMATIRALERVGKYFLTHAARPYRGKITRVPPWELHTMGLKIEPSDYDKVLSDWDGPLKAACPDEPCLVETVHVYVHDLLEQGRPHSKVELAARLIRSGCVGSQYA